MRVQIVGRTASGVPCDWVVVDDDGIPDPLAARFLAFKSSTGASPNTVRAYAYDIAAYLTFLREVGLGVDDVSNEVLGRFARYLRSPAEDVVAFTDAEAARERATVNRALSAVAAFYPVLGSGGRGAVGYRGYKRLQETAGAYRRGNRTVVDSVGAARRYQAKVRLGPRLPKKEKRLSILTIQEVHSVLEACRTNQERLFFLLCATTGMRIGQVLGLRHSDLDTRSRTVSIVPRDDNENGVRAKSRAEQDLPVPREVTRLYVKYMHEDYGYIDSDYVFIRLTGARAGQALTPSTIYGVVSRIRKETGIARWSPHTLRHTYVTLQQEAGVPIDVISNLVTHASVQTTVDIYSHLSVEALRTALIRAGAWDEGELDD